METVLELENTAAGAQAQPSIARKKFRADEVYKMMQVGILPEASGWELINGEIIRRMTIGSKHASTVKRLNRFFTNQVGENAIVSVQDPIHIDEYNEPEPDIALLKPRADFYAESHPESQDVLLVIEVSDSTVDFDREVKKTLYAEAGISEFWLVNLRENTVECHSQPKNKIYRLTQIFEKGEAVESVSIENLRLKVEDILGL
jgi:Uma2 family endonuclease